MKTGIPLSFRTNIQDLATALDSVAAHIAAKLECFNSDERTLTDELCDMLSIALWHLSTQNQKYRIPHPYLSSIPSTQFQIDLAKTTAPEEDRIGADFELAVSTPSGFKHALFQAKAIDSVTSDFRNRSRATMRFMAKQLRKMRQAARNTSFLLAYIPASHLDGANQGFTTWEQQLYQNRNQNISIHSSRNGASTIGVNVLLVGNNQLLSKKKFTYSSHNLFTPSSQPLTITVLGLIACTFGIYSNPDQQGSVVIPKQKLSLSFSDVEKKEWDSIITKLRNYLLSLDKSNTKLNG